MKTVRFVFFEMIWISLTFALLNACESDYDIKGVCEKKVHMYDNVYSYSCVEESKGYCDAMSKSVFYEGGDCGDLGYTYYDDALDEWEADDEYGYTPGANGAFADDATGGLGGIVCDTYNGYTGDTQAETLCKTAWRYACSGSQDAVDATCQNYNGLKNLGDLPDCVYCK